MGSMYLLIFLMLCAGIGAWLYFLWAVKSGQYDDVEGPKFRMLDDDEPDTGRRSGADEHALEKKSDASKTDEIKHQKHR